MEEVLNSRSPHIALLADIGTGHLIPVAALAKHLLTKHNLSITLITQPTSLSSISHQSILKTLPEQISIISLPQLPTESIPKGTMPHESSLITVAHNLVHLRDVLKSLTSTTAASPVTSLIVDIFGIIALDVAREVGLTTYLFFTTNCLILSLGYYLPGLEATMTGEFRDLAEPLRPPGCVPIPGRDLPEPFRDRKSESYHKFLHYLKLFRLPNGILVNSFEELEPGPLKATRADTSLPPVYPVGPLVWSGACEPERPGCLKWLDEQPAGSVIYVSFGSGGTLSRDQMEEVALGLEMSGQRFVWVVKSPSESESSADYLGVVMNSTGPGPLEALPAGFTERNRGVGFVIPVWAPQMEVLSHEATGGFLTHCGWNSILESIVNGVPMVAWPLYAEQATNAVILAEDLKVAVRVGAGEGGVVRREEIAGLVRGLMEGEAGKRLRSRMREVRDAAAAALEEGGSSHGSCSEIVREWKSLVR